MTLQELAEKLRAASEWSNFNTDWEQLPDYRKHRWLRFAEKVQAIIDEEIKKCATDK